MCDKELRELFRLEDDVSPDQHVPGESCVAVHGVRLSVVGTLTHMERRAPVPLYWKNPRSGGREAVRYHPG